MKNRRGCQVFVTGLVLMVAGCQCPEGQFEVTKEYVTGDYLRFFRHVAGPGVTCFDGSKWVHGLPDDTASVIEVPYRVFVSECVALRSFQFFIYAHQDSLWNKGPMREIDLPRSRDTGIIRRYKGFPCVRTTELENIYVTAELYFPIKGCVTNDGQIWPNEPFSGGKPAVDCSR